MGGTAWLASRRWCGPGRSCFRLLPHGARRAASRADWTAGRSRAMSTAMIAMTTRSSMSVKAERLPRILMAMSLDDNEGRTLLSISSYHFLLRSCQRGLLYRWLELDTRVA